MVLEKQAAAVMKGHLHTDILLGEIVKREGGLRRGGRRLSHVFVMDVPGLDHLLMVTDAAINITPDLKTKADIIQNAIDLALTLGIEQPKVGVLSAVETVNPAIPSTLDAAILSKMADRGQITGGLVDGPLAMDNAIDLGAAATKGITSLVAGRADILIAPNMEAGNMLAKELTYLAQAQAGGIVMGAKCPIILTSRSDGRSGAAGLLRDCGAERGGATGMSVILTLNAGSSSLKYAVYLTAAEPELLQAGQVENIGPLARLTVKGGGATSEIGPADHTVAVSAILAAIDPLLDGRQVAGVGHRIVHGGKAFGAPVRLTEDILAQLTALVPLAPLHQPQNLTAVQAAQAAFPDAVQIGCFDTGFHRGHPFVNDAFALPRKFYEQGVRRYGFHGLSYDYVTGVLERDWYDLAQGRVVVAHLGNGASMCAVRDGRSIGSTMGFSALDGLPMGTRCGQLDPGVILYLMDQGMNRDEIARMLYRESGLKGLSDISHDMRTLLASDDPRAAQAIDYYVFRIRREMGAMAAVLGGLDGVVFTGGIGENAAPIRQRVIDGMGFLGLELDVAANDASAVSIGAGAAKVLVIRTDEERVIARAVAQALAG